MGLLPVSIVCTNTHQQVKRVFVTTLAGAGRFSLKKTGRRALPNARGGGRKSKRHRARKENGLMIVINTSPFWAEYVYCLQLLS